MEQIERIAKEYGFSHCAVLNITSVQVIPEVRQMCESDRCHACGKNWSCPPACGSLEECKARLQRFSQGFLVQSVGKTEDSFDYESMIETEKRHKDNFQKMCHFLRSAYPEMLAIGAGCCTLCRSCTYPDAPCRFPEEMTSSMEAYGMLVSQVCRDSGLEYNHGPNTVTFTSCFFLR